MLTDYSKDTINEFVENINQDLDISAIEVEHARLSNLISKNEEKTQKLIDLRIENKIDMESYDKKYIILKKEFKKFSEEINIIKEALNSEKSISMRINKFKSTFNKVQVLNEFDRIIFDAIIENVIVGATNKEGKPMPRALTFVLKTGLEISDDVLKSINENMEGIEEDE